MHPAPMPPDEAVRLSALHALGILDTPPDATFDALVRVAALVCGAPISLISLLREDTQWFKAQVGLDRVAGTRRDVAFCGHTILGDELFEIPDALADPRFADNPLVTGSPDIRFYAGVPLRVGDGHKVGTLCVIDRSPRVLSATQRAILHHLAHLAGQALESWAIRRKQARTEAALERANERVTLAVECAGIGIWDWDVVTGAHVWDTSMYRIYAQAPDSGQSSYDLWRQCLHPDDRSAAETAVADAVARTRPYDTEFRIVRDDGTVRYIRAVARAVGPAGAPAVRLVGINWDVTEAREAAIVRDNHALRLAESEADFRLLAENSRDMISWVDRDGTRRYVSPACADIFGVPAQTVTDRGQLPFVHPDDRAGLVTLQAGLLAGRLADGRATFRIQQTHKDVVWAEVSAKALLASGGAAPSGYVSVVRDVTERVRLETERDARAHELQAVNAELQRMARHLMKARDAADQANGAKSRFLAGMSHELRTPLHGILGHAQLLRLEGDLSAGQSRRVDAMLGAGRHLLDMIGSVLEMSEVEAEHVEIRPVEVDLRMLGGECLELLRPRAQRKGLTLHLDMAAGVPAVLVTDAMRLRQILLNLVGNAVKFTARGSVVLRVRAAAGGAAIAIEVTDTGPGINEAARPRLFHDFERLGADNAGNNEGAGLGLALSARLATLIGGRIGHDHNPGGGSIFWLELPRDVAALRPAPAAAASAAPDAPAALRVLVVDDIAMNRDIACAFLRAAGHAAEVAVGGAEAVATIIVESFDAVLMDVRMPDVDGLEATRRIRALGGAAGQVPIIGLTAQAFADQVQACLAAGMDCHLAKPYTAAGLAAALAQARAGRQGRLAVMPPDAPPPAASPLAALPVRDRDIAARIGICLAPSVIAAYTRTVAARCADVLRELRHAAAAPPGAGTLADAAHVLGGAAAMLGFVRVSETAVSFERAARSGTNAPPHLADELGAAIEATLDEIHLLQHIALESKRKTTSWTLEETQQ